MAARTFVVAVSISLAACAPTQAPQTARITGGAIGGAAGGAACHALADDGGDGVQSAATAGCALLGALAGARVGEAVQRLTRGERVAQRHAVRTAAATGTVREWANPKTGHKGRVTPGPKVRRADRPCRRFQTTITINGENHKGHGTACKGPQGRWQIQTRGGAG